MSGRYAHRLVLVHSNSPPIYRLQQRLTAPPSDKARCKLSVIGDATADIREALDSDILEPYESHFHPPPSGGKTSTSSRRTGQAMHAVTSIPYAEQVIAKGQIDQWDYCLRRLFVMKNTPVKNALKYVYLWCAMLRVLTARH